MAIYEYDKVEKELNPLAGTPTARLQAMENNIGIIETDTGYKNLIQYPYDTKNSLTRNGITFTLNDDGSITVNGSTTTDESYFNIHVRTDTTSGLNHFPNGNLILTGCPSGGSNTSYRLWVGHTNPDTGSNEFDAVDYGDGSDATFVGNSEYYYTVQIGIRANTTVSNLTFYPMVRYANIQDDTYVNPKKKSQSDINSNGISDIVNVYGAKNLIKYPYSLSDYSASNVNFVDNGDGSIGVSTSVAASSTVWYAFYGANMQEFPMLLKAGTYILSQEGISIDDAGYRCQVLKLGQAIATTNYVTKSYTFTLTEDTYVNIGIRVPTGLEITGDIVKPMLRMANIEDNTWQPYSKTNKELTVDNTEQQAEINDIVNVYGAKNLLQYPYYSTTTTISGVTITDNGDGTLTLDGTATDRISYNITATASYNLLEIGKKYLIGFKTSDDTIDSNSWALRIYCKKDSVTVLSTTDSRGLDVAFTVPEETVGANVQFIIVSGTVLNNVVIKPMIRLASIKDDTYVPYAMTNQELTKKITPSSWIDISSDASDYISSGYIKYKKIGQLVIVKLWDVIFKSDGSGNALSTNLPTCDDNVTNRIFRDQREGLGALYMNNNSKNLYCHHANPSGDTTQTKWYGEMVYTTSD